MAATQSGATLTTDGINLINEDDARRIAFGLFKKVADAGSADTNKHLHEFGAGDGEEGYSCFTGDGTREKGFTGSGITDQKHTLRDAGAQCLELLT